ncbi:MAG: hypothetical protein P4L53_22295 [Candidatus Obscuribacterales bacterium]|nr:hypothetical protein [Candidatus Obscuribacterales bacterium]
MTSPPTTIEPLNDFERNKGKNVSQAVGFVIIIGLNISLIGSDIHLIYGRHILNWHNELMTGSFLTFLDLTTLLPMIFQVRRLRMWEDKIIISTMLWTSKLTWNQITDLTHPQNFTLSILKTKRCFYLINRKDLPEVELFFAKVKEKLG